MSDVSVFDEGSPALPHLLRAITEGIEEGEGKSVSALIYLINDETGQIISASNLAPEQITHFLTHVLRAQRAGEYSAEQHAEETKR